MPLNCHEVRLASPADVASVLEIAREVHEWQAREREPGIVEFAQHSSYYLRAIENPEEILLVAETDRVAGYCLALIETEVDDLTVEPRMETVEIAVRELFRGRGIGRALMLAAEEWGRGKGVSLAQLSVWGHSVAALRLYEKSGYGTIMRKMEKRL